MTFTRRTVATAITFEGRGLHLGTPVRAVVGPGSNGIGFWDGTNRIAAIPENVTDTTRSTRLGSIGTIEHMMGALAGVGITDAEIEVIGGELPALDGAAATYAFGIRDAGHSDIAEQQLPDPFARVFEKSELSSIAIASGEGHWRYTFDAGERWPGRQGFEIEISAEGFLGQVAPCRTFAFSEEVDALRRAGMGQGLDLENALLLGPSGYLNPAKFEDEPARHKLLDLIGDLYLSGVPPQFLDVVAERSGHSANVRAAMKLSAAIRNPLDSSE